jgi:SAM-dependent methyltransferase
MQPTQPPPLDDRRAHAREIAGTLLRGLESHPECDPPAGPAAPHPAPVGAAPDWPSDFALLRDRSDMGAPPPGRSGPVGLLLRIVRGLAAYFVQPWFDRQTAFNRIAADMMQRTVEQDALRASMLRDEIVRLTDLVRLLRNEVSAVEERTAIRFRGLSDRTAALSGDTADLRSRVESLAGAERFWLYEAAVNRELAGEGRIAAEGLWSPPAVEVRLGVDGRPAAAVTERVATHGFALTRLPPAPARVLHLGGGTTALELAAMGYEVAAVEARPTPLSHPSLRTFVADPCRLPFPDGDFDAVVSTTAVGFAAVSDDRAAIAEAARVLRPGGRLIVAVPFGRLAAPGRRVYDAAGLDALLTGLRRLETKFGVRDGEAWSLSEDLDRAERADSSLRLAAVALVVAERA